MEKVLEQLEVARKEAYRQNNLCLVVILDVKNAFNSARWNGVIRKIKRRQIKVELTSVVENEKMGLSFPSVCRLSPVSIFIR